jgi:RecB family exonuclease
MPRKPTLSPSKITTYLACPTKYRWTFVDDRGKWYLRSKSYYSFGTTLHNVLQRFHDAEDAGVTCTHEAVTALEESWIDAGYASQQEMQEALAEGKQIVEQYIEREFAEPTTARTLFVEKLLRSDFDRFDLIGRLDRVDECEDGTLEVVDYKSGRREVTEEQVKSDLAMGVYQLLLKDIYPDRPVKATIVALRGNLRASASLSEAELTGLRDDLKFLGNEILDRDLQNVAPRPKTLCVGCDFVPLCRTHPEFEPPEGA